jgi:hypothetical protein
METINKLVNSCYFYFLRLPAWLLILFFSFTVMFTGILTESRFNDGLFHLQVAETWYYHGQRPLTVESANGITPVSYAPMWYWTVQLISKICGRFHFFAAQFVQTICYCGVISLTYILAKTLYKNPTKAKLALIQFLL